MNEPAATCRLSTNYYPPDVFQSVACAQCLFFIYFVGNINNKNYKVQQCGANGLLICENGDPLCSCDNPDVVYNIPEYALNKTAIKSLRHLKLNPQLASNFYEIVSTCCAAAKECCDNDMSTAKSTNAACPATWDGWQCFSEATPSETPITAQCPPYIYADELRYIEEPLVMKTCTASGWEKRPEAEGNEWTDYTECSSEKKSNAKFIAGVVSFSISVLAIIPALFIISTFRTLKTQPVFIIHKHLLLSFLLSGICYLFTSFFFLIPGAPGDMFLFRNHIVCRVVFMIQLRFLRLSTFSWMLAEGVYLFRLLYKSFSDGDNLTIYKLICWGVPVIVSTLYGALREAFDNEACWISPSIYPSIEATIMAPCLICICINFLLVAVILFTLVKKLRYNPHLEPMQYRLAVVPSFIFRISGAGVEEAEKALPIGRRGVRRTDSFIARCRQSFLIPPAEPTPAELAAVKNTAVVIKAVRAALMLVPVFGLHFLFTIPRMDSSLHQIMNLTMDGLQGFAVSVILVYANSNVGQAVKKWIKDIKDSRVLQNECTFNGTRSSIPNGKKKISATIDDIANHNRPVRADSQDYREPLMPKNGGNATPPTHGMGPSDF